MRLFPGAPLPLPRGRSAGWSGEQAFVAGESPAGRSLRPLGRLVPRNETDLRALNPVLERRPEGVPADGSLPQRPLTRLAPGHRVCGKPRSTWLVAGSGQREVTTFPRV